MSRAIPGTVEGKLKNPFQIKETSFIIFINFDFEQSNPWHWGGKAKKSLSNKGNILYYFYQFCLGAIPGPEEGALKNGLQLRKIPVLFTKSILFRSNPWHWGENWRWRGTPWAASWRRTYREQANGISRNGWPNWWRLFDHVN